MPHPPTYWSDLQLEVAQALYLGEEAWADLASSFRASLMGAAEDLLAEHATWRDRYLNCVCGEWYEPDGGTHRAHVLAMARGDHLRPEERNP